MWRIGHRNDRIYHDGNFAGHCKRSADRDYPGCAFYSTLCNGSWVGAPVLTLLTARISPKKVLLFLMVLFLIFNGLFAIAPEFHSLAISRFLSGLPHGAFFGAGSVVAA